MYFAVAVKTGSELAVKKILGERISKFAFTQIRDVIAFETFTTKITSSSGTIKKFKSAVKGYVFLDVPGSNFSIPPEVFQFVKAIPFVSKVLEYSISETEFLQFFEHVNVEETVEFSSSTIVDDEVTEQIENVMNGDSKESFVQDIIKKCKVSIRRKKYYVSAHISVLTYLNITINEAKYKLLDKILSIAGGEGGALVT